MNDVPTTIEKVKALNKRKGGYFFSPGAMRGFDSRIEKEVYPAAKRTYFVTSEQFHGSQDDGPRLWTVRYIRADNGDIGTIGEFQEFTTAADAHAAAAACQEEDS